MGTIAEQINYLADTKTAIKEALVAKGVSVSEDATFRSYAEKIGEIQSGGGSQIEYWKIDDAEKFKADITMDLFPMFVLLIKVGFPFAPAVTLSGGLTDSAAWELILGFAIDKSVKLLSTNTGVVTVGELLDMMSLDFTQVGCSKISEAEFYSAE